MKKDGNYHLVSTNKIAAETRARHTFLKDGKNQEERVLEELEYKLFKSYKQFLSTIDSSERYFVMGEAVISESNLDDGHTILYTSEAYIYEVTDIPARTEPIFEVGSIGSIDIGELVNGRYIANPPRESGFNRRAIFNEDYINHYRSPSPPPVVFRTQLPPSFHSTGEHIYTDNEQSVVLPNVRYSNLDTT